MGIGTISLKNTLKLAKQEDQPVARSLLDSETCGCGCGRPPVEGREMEAVLLGISRQTLRQLKAKAKSGGERKRKAEQLLWAWNRCEDGFEAYVHGTLLRACGPPTPLWVNSWRRRVEEL